ncbi:MAG: flagellar protein FlaG [Bacillota bacterium]
MSVVQAVTGRPPAAQDTQGWPMAGMKDAGLPPVQAAPVANAVDAANRIAELTNTRLSFGYDEQAGRAYVMVIESGTGEVIKQIPPERMLEMLAQVRKQIGLILDEKA